MFEALIAAMAMLVEPMNIVALTGGVLLGLFFGVVPGLGGVAGLALLLPFTFHLDSSVAIIMMVGLFTAISISDIFPSILMGVPGSAGSQATIIDGYPMTKRGEGNRALGAGFAAATFGGIIGGIILFASLPILRPFVLSFGSPEFFMLGLLGITMVAALSKGSMIRGFLAAALGLVISMVGVGPQTAHLRWTFDNFYLAQGVPFIPLALGLFAIPEIIEIYVKGTSISPHGKQQRERFWSRLTSSIKDVASHWFLAIRTSFVGIAVGVIPGLGNSVVDWFAYGHALTSERDARKTFGKGDVRGVIAPETASSSMRAGGLIPTLAFGIPGSPAMAVFMGGMLFHDIIPGPQMLTRNLDVTLLIVLALIASSIVGGLLCIGLIRFFGKVAAVPAHFIVPAILVVCVFASFQQNWDYMDLLFLLGFSILGWSMKVGGWSRPALVLAVVLGPILEQYYFLSTGRFGFDWITRPAVLVIAAIIVLAFVFGFRSDRRERAREEASQAGNG
ncbi:tripartite tricarboxylate transporter permease [Pseudochelatococcus sp. B33]